MDSAKICRWRCVFTSNIKASSSSETKSQKSCFSTQDTLTSFKKIQWQIINFDKSLKIMWYGRDAITAACSVYLSLLICGHIFTITTVECVFVHSIIQGFGREKDENRADLFCVLLYFLLKAAVFDFPS